MPKNSKNKQLNLLISSDDIYNMQFYYLIIISFPAFMALLLLAAPVYGADAIAGSIAKIGTEYVVGLKAVSCANGEHRNGRARETSR